MTWIQRLSFPDVNGWVEIICLAVIFYYVLFSSAAPVARRP